MAAILKEKQVLTDQELREQIMLEIEKKFKVCLNASYPCTLPRIDNYEYCMRHILQDPRGHYKQCAHVHPNGAHVHPNGRRCTNALPKTHLSLCFEHSRKAQLNKTRAAVGKYQAVDSNEVFLNNLAQHFNLKETVKRARILESSQEDEIDVVSSNEPTFVAYKHMQSLDSFIEKPRKRRVLDYASDSSSNECSLHPNLSNTSVGLEFDNSDNESTNSVDEDLLKHAEIFSRQEIVRISQSKLTKLQNFYIEQVHHLHRLLKDRRRKYLVALRKEREILCSIHNQAKETPRERMLYKELKAYNNYHQRHGVEAVLHKKLKEKRAKMSIDGHAYKPPSFTKCVYTEGGVKCATRALPCSKYCRKHILEDKKQTLFSACSIERAGIVCQEAIPRIFDELTCMLHVPFPGPKHFPQKKNDTEPEDDDSISKNVKIETIATTATTTAKAEKETTETSAVLYTQMPCLESSTNNATAEAEAQPQAAASSSSAVAVAAAPSVSSSEMPSHVLATKLAFKNHFMPTSSTFPIMK